MAVTISTNVTAGGSTAGWAVNCISDDFSAAEVALAAVTGNTHWVQQAIISNGGTARTVTIGAGETSSAVTAAMIGPIACAANSTQILKFLRPLSVGVSTALVIDASGASAGSTIFIEGYTTTGSAAGPVVA